MKRALLAIVCLAVPSVALAADPAEALPVDKATTVQGIEAACTGTGQSKQDPQWKTFPVRIEFADSKGEYLTDAEVRVVTAAGKPVAQVSCGAPWVLLKLPPGDYRAFARLTSGGPERSTAFKVPKTGQVRAVVAFPEG